jgi:hypothetical protein
MATKKQIAANRRNAEKSTGPRSVEGKAASSRNALKTGLYCRGIIIGKEDPTKLDELEAAYSAEYAPVTPTERALVDSLIHYEWLLRRYRWLETETWRATYARLSPSQCEDHSWTGIAFMEQPAIARIHRLRNQTQRLFHETLDKLRALQAERVAADAPQSEADAELTPQLIQNTATWPENGFVSPMPVDDPPESDLRPSPGSRNAMLTCK